MAAVENKENLAPLESSDPLQIKSGTPSPKKAGRKGRSKSIGPGGLDEPEGLKKDVKTDAKSRRKSTYVPATKSIISNDTEKAERQAARRKTLANRRVSFAPEATLHTWDVVEFMRDPTTSTDSSDNTRRTSRSGGGTPVKRAQDLSSDPPSTPPEQAHDVKTLSSSPANHNDLQQKQRRRSSGIPPMNFNNPDDMSSGISGSSDVSESEDEDAEGSDDDTGTAMGLDVDNNTVQSIGESESGSTDSSGRLEAALRQAAETAGTRGIEFDEHGDASMELAGDEVTNAFKPFAEERAAIQPLGSASLDQENVNPFSPAFKAQLISGIVSRPSTVAEEDTGEMSMDITRAVGNIVTQPTSESASSPLGDGTMELTQAVGNIQQPGQGQSPQNRSGQKRRRSTTEAGSPGAAVSVSQSKRRRSSIARSSMGDDTMDLTMAMGSIQSAGSPAKPERRKGTPKRRSSGNISDREEATMDFTQAVGGIKPASQVENTGSSFDENEELTMELTTVLGDIKAAEKGANDARPMTPQNQSPVKDKVNTTPKDQERFKNAPDSGPKKLLTPIFQKQLLLSAEKSGSSAKPRKSTSPASRTQRSVAFAQPDENATAEQERVPSTPLASPVKEPHAEMLSLGDHYSPLRATPSKNPATRRNSATPNSALQQQLDLQLQAPEPSPTAQKQQRSSPVKTPSTPQQVHESPQEGRRLAESIKMMSTPRKETLKNAPPNKQAPAAQLSPPVAPMSKTRPTMKGKTNTHISPERQLSEDLHRIQFSGDSVKKVQLQEFLDAAGIRFMDLTTTKRRMTTAITPSKAQARKAGDPLDGPEDIEVSLENAIVAGGCTVPELEMYEHACHELKRYISDGKKVIKELEVETVNGTPPLIQAYMAAGSKRRATMDAQMRDIKTHARYRSKEMWYAWRAQLLDDLMKALQGIGEGLIKDDETLQHAEEILDQVLPGLAEQHDSLQTEAERLEQEAAATNEDEKEELESARERLQAVDQELAEKQKLLEQLQKEMGEQETLVNDLEESKEEFTAAIQEADRVKESCRGVSIKEITDLKESIHNIERTSGWAITSASNSPPTVTMTYKSQLQLFFHPSAFQPGKSNSPISLSYTANQPPTTTLRFFLQLLRASLQALPQSTTRVAALLSLVSNGWETALSIAEAERRLNVEALTEARIVSDERLSIAATILLPKVRTKVRVEFEIASAVGESEELELSTTVEPAVRVVYGEQYNEKKMTEFLEREVGDGFEGWHSAVRDLRARLVARGAKGQRR